MRMDKKTLDKCIAVAMSSLKDTHCVGYKVFNVKGVDTHCEHTACYASCRPAGEGSIIINKLQKNGYHQHMIAKGDDYFVDYLDFLLNDSVYSPTFETKDAKKALADGYIISNTDRSGQLTVGAMTAMRGMWEQGVANKSNLFFNSLVKGGCTRDFAFLMCHGMSGDGRYYPRTYGSHSAIDFSSLTVDGVIDFIKREIYKEADPYWSTNNYNGIHAMWARSHRKPANVVGQHLFSRWFDTAWKELKGDKKVAKTAKTNPFAPEPIFGARQQQNRINFTNKDDLATLVEVCNKFYEEFIK